jgi:hypothetical protein
MGRTPLQQAGEKPYVQSDSSTNIYENTSTISTLLSYLYTKWDTS